MNILHYFTLSLTILITIFFQTNNCLEGFKNVRVIEFAMQYSEDCTT